MRDRSFNRETPLRLTPGPSEVSPAVLSACTEAVVGHRTAPFRRVVRDLRDMVLLACELPQDGSYASVTISGTGSSAMEAMAASLAPGQRCLVLVNGRFGQRLADMVALHAGHCHVEAFGPGGRVDASRVEEVIRKDGFDYLFFCAQDTRDAVLNDFDVLTTLAQQAGVKVCMDAISAEVSEPLSEAIQRCEAVSVSSGKAFGGLPGLGIVIARTAVLETLATRRASSYYLDLGAYHQVESRTFEPRFAPALPLYFALHRALTELLASGVEARRALTHQRTDLARSVLSRVKVITPLHDLNRMPHSVTSYRLPPRVRFDDYQEALLDRGVLVYQGSSVLPDVFQIGTAGYMTDETFRWALCAVQETLESVHEASSVVVA